MLGVCKNAASAIIKTAKPAVSLAKLNGASHKLIPAAYNREYRRRARKRAVRCEQIERHERLVCSKLFDLIASLFWAMARMCDPG